MVATCLALKCHYNNPSVAEIPTWVRTIVLNWLAKFFRVKIPPGLVKVIKKHFEEKAEAREEIEFERRNSVLPPTGICRGSISRRTSAFSERRCSHASEAASTIGLPQLFNTCANCLETVNEEHPTTDDSPPQNIPLSLEISMKEMLLKQDNLLKNVRRLVHYVRENEANEIKREEWKLVAAVIDACFFWLFMLTLIISTLAIFLQAPSY